MVDEDEPKNAVHFSVAPVCATAMQLAVKRSESSSPPEVAELSHSPPASSTCQTPDDDFGGRCHLHGGASASVSVSVTDLSPASACAPLEAAPSPR
ncbi:hypothetical protein EG329_001067 [Mollisiaceae sp. DMI_Dod_QoI]|nr:hypothetical protein EG329_001067 [Helotiales sp. DMI_Dod_QoI]